MGLLIFGPFKQTLQILQETDVKKYPFCSDSNSQPFKNESPLIASRPGLLSIFINLLFIAQNPESVFHPQN